jgi:NAD(P)-dependent dehydrogenase (short-subunit alcohol dehydrogenase family)
MCTLAGYRTPKSKSFLVLFFKKERSYFSMTVLQDRIAFVTGASRGIGAATAIALAKLGAHVVITARTQGGLEETDDAIRAAGGTATLLPLDLTKPDNLDPIGPSLVQRFGRLDILVHNAGALGRLTPAGHITPKDLETCLQVNFHATYRLIRTCGPVLAASDAGRAVFVTSSVARTPRAYWGAYAATKAAMEMLVRCWADEVENTKLRVNLFDPGATATRMRATAFPGEDPRTLKGPASRAEELVALCLPDVTRNGGLLRAA